MAYLPSDRSLGIKKEATYGTAATVDQHVSFVNESLQRVDSYLQSEGLRVGRVGPALSGRLKGKTDVSGDIEIEADSIDVATFLEAAFGTVATGGATAPYFRLFTPSEQNYPPSYTIQKGVPLNGGASLAAHTFTGMVCSQLQVNAANDAILHLSTTWLGKDMDTSTALVTPAYTAGSTLLQFHKASLKVGDTLTVPSTTALASSTATNAATIRDIQFTLANNLDGNGWNFGGNGKRSRVPAYGRRALTGQFTAEFDAVTLRDASLSGAGLGLLLEFTGGAGEVLQFAIPRIVLDANVPAGNETDVITQQFNFTAYDNGTDKFAYALLQNSVAIV